MAALPTRLLGRDYLVLACFCAALYGFAIANHRRLTTHEAIHCENVREMLESGSWIIPTCGGRPWLERPPLPHWITAAFVAITGQTQAEWAYRLGSMMAGITAIMLTAWLAARMYGRGLGMLAEMSIGPDGADMQVVCPFQNPCEGCKLPTTSSVPTVPTTESAIAM